MSVSYDYRDRDGELFSCVAVSLEAAREKREAWLKARPKQEQVLTVTEKSNPPESTFTGRRFWREMFPPTGNGRLIRP
ncbi:MAG: DUF3873 domain-containing protein [Desulfovibrio sp.]|nr:DUF3873 domain-containing protein [Desulfovibrio sp.]